MLPVLAIVCILCSMSLAQEATPDATALAALQTVSSSNLNFTNSIYKILSKTEGNVLFSPTNIQTILAKLLTGAEGETAKQMTQGLHFPEDSGLAEAVYTGLVTSMKGEGNMALEFAEFAFTNVDSLKLKEFKETERSSYVTAQLKIWMEGNDMGLVPEETLAFATMANAFNFASEWANRFSIYATEPEPFFVTPTESKEVQMMRHRTDKLGFLASEELDCQVIELPYQGDRVSLFVLLPNTRDGLADLETKLPNLHLHHLLDTVDNIEMIVRLPKFRLEQTLDLNQVLTKIGMVDMFGGSANFSGLAESSQSIFALYVNKVMHKTSFEVLEAGREGAPAEPIFQPRIGRGKPVQKEIRADHPFLFFLREKSTKAVLFMGRVSSP